MKKKQLARYKKAFLIIVGVMFAAIVFINRTTILQFFQNELSPLPISNGTAQLYSGILPCADCSGLETSLTLHPSASNPTLGTYALKQIYQGKQVSPLTETGVWTMMAKTFNGKETNVYRLIADKTNQVTYYMQLDATHLQLLDSDGNEIVTPFNITLTKEQ